MQRRAVADLEVDGDALRALGAKDQHGRVALQHRIVDGLAGFLGDARAGRRESRLARSSSPTRCRASDSTLKLSR